MNAILTVKNISKSFGGLEAVQNCSWNVAENSITGLIGPNGAGKTTMFDLITGFLAADRGSIFFHKKDITNAAIWTRTHCGISRTFQMIRLFPELTVIDNIMVCFPDTPDFLFDIFHSLKNKKKELRERAVTLLKTVKLDSHSHAKAKSLSYGQQKLLEILRAVACLPINENKHSSLLLLDEPAAGVNRTMLHEITSLIKKLKAEGKTILIVEHDMNFVMNLCEKIIVMDAGRELAIGTPQEIQNNPKVLEAYLGVKR